MDGLAGDVIAGGGRGDLLRAACRLARFAAGGEITWEFAEQIVGDLGDLIGRAPGEMHRLWRYARANGEGDPRRAPTAGRMATGDDVVGLLLGWWTDRVCADRMLIEQRSGASARKALAAFLLSGLIANRLEVAESQRELAERAGMSRDTLNRTRPLWGRHVNLVRAGSRRAGTRSVWRIVTTEPGERFRTKPEARDYGPSGLVRKRSPGLVPVVPGSSGLTAPDSNTWYRCAGCWMVWTLLDTDVPVTPKELAAEAGRHVTSVRRILRGMARDGIAVRTPDGWLLVPGAAEPPSADHAAERRERHRAERAAYAARTHTRRAR